MDSQKFINNEGVVARTTLSRSVIYRLMQTADFPQPYSIAGVEKRKVWAVSEVDDWLKKNTIKQAV